MDVKGIIQFTLWDRGLGVFFPAAYTALRWSELLLQLPIFLRIEGKTVLL